ESLGEDAAGRARHLAEAAAESAARGRRAAGDGRLAPHEWRRAAEGRLQKLDSAGHDADHTAIGRQPAAWDVAGALIEWDLDEQRAAMLLGAYYAAGGDQLPPRLLRFYSMAYAAFRLGQCAMCSG